MRTTRALLTTAMAVAMLAFTAPAAATDEQCLAGDKECEPKVSRITATAVVCGDPRMWVRVDNDSRWPAAVKVVFKTGDKTAQPALRVVKKTVGRYDTRVIGPRWTRGGGAKVKVWARDWQTDAYDQLLLKFRLRDPVPWGVGVCPDDRFGGQSIDWRFPHYGQPAIVS